jgi:Secretion system C-terminal sorting domain/SprB repeat
MIKKVHIIFLILVLALGQNSLNAQEWISSSIIDGDNLVDVVDIVVDESKNTIIYGKLKGTLNFDGTDYSSNIADKNDLFIACYNSLLQPVWFRSFGSDDHDISGNIIINAIGNIVISGSHRNTIKFTTTDSLVSEGITDNFIAEYSISGNLISFKNIGRGSNIQLIKSLDQDKYSNYILSGTFKDSIMVDEDTIIGRSTLYENFILRLDAAFNTDTLIEINGNNNRTVINSVKAAPDGYYFSGKYRDSIYFDIDILYNSSGVDNIFIYKTDFDLNGTYIREATGDGNDNTGTFVNDNYGNVYLAGYFQSSDFVFDSTELIKSNKGLINNGGLDIYLTKYNKNGNLIWARNYGGISDDWASDINLKNNVLYITGYYSDTIVFKNDTLISSGVEDRNTFIGTFDLDGNMLIAEDIVGSDGNDDSGIGLELYDNNAIITGFFQSASITIGSEIYVNTTPGVKDVFVAEFEPGFLAAFTDISTITCNGTTDGELIVTPYFGTEPYSYSWSHNGSLNDSTASGLGSDIYTVTITDALSSETFVTYDLTEPDPITFNALVTDVITCSYSEEGIIDLNMSGGNGDYKYQWQASNGGYGLTLIAEDQLNLTISTYNVTVTDSKNCTADTNINITGPDPITFTGSVVTDSSELGGPGAIDLAYSGGFGGSFTFAWQGPTGPVTHSKDTSNLSPGNYNVTVTDAHACDFDTTFNVANLDTFYIYISEYKDACSGTINGSATVSYKSPEMHTTGINYLWDLNTGSQTTAQAINLAPGRYYYVTVTDTENSPNTVVVDSVYIDVLTYSFDGSLSGTTTLDCYGDNDGYVDLSITSEGTLPYSYNWDNGSTSQDIVGLEIGTYNVTVTDDYNCQFIKTNFIISQPTAISAVAEIVVSPSCNGDFNGEITVERSGGISPYTYQWDDPGYQSDRNADGLDAGYYTVTVADVNNCTKSTSIELTDPDPIGFSKTVYNIACNGSSNGVVIITHEGGTLPFSYLWYTTDGSGLAPNNKNQGGLSEGTYFLIVSDYYGCIAEDSVKIAAPPAIIIDIESSEDASDATTADGSITVEASGGTGDLTYTLNEKYITNQTGVFNSLLPGDYTVDVTDENFCGPLTSGTLKVSFPDGIVDFISGERIQIYPNPASDRLFVKTEYKGEFTIQIVNVSGSIIYTKHVSVIGEENRLEVDVINYPKGIYFVRLYNKEISINRKIILQ